MANQPTVKFGLQNFTACFGWMARPPCSLHDILLQQWDETNLPFTAQQRWELFVFTHRIRSLTMKIHESKPSRCDLHSFLYVAISVILAANCYWQDGCRPCWKIPAGAGLKVTGTKHEEHEEQRVVILGTDPKMSTAARKGNGSGGCSAPCKIRPLF